MAEEICDKCGQVIRPKYSRLEEVERIEAAVRNIIVPYPWPRSRYSAPPYDDIKQEELERKVLYYIKLGVPVEELEEKGNERIGKINRWIEDGKEEYRERKRKWAEDEAKRKESK